MPNHHTPSIPYSLPSLNTNLKYDSVGSVKKGEKYEWVATSPTTGWYAIRMDKWIGWVSPNYSKVEAA